jgi:hypothetical protein
MYTDVLILAITIYMHQHMVTYAGGDSDSTLVESWKGC